MVKGHIQYCVDTGRKFKSSKWLQPSVVTSIIEELETGFVVPNLSTLTEFKTCNSQLNHSFLESFLEAFSEGILVFDLSGVLLYVNEAAHSLFERTIVTSEQQKALEREIQVMYQLMVEQPTERDETQTSVDETPLRSVEVEVMLTLDIQLSIHVQRFQVCSHPNEMVWVRLEDQQRLSRARALLESRWYGLSEREGEVWQLRQAGCTYAEVAQQLFITTHTVKKHVRNIKAKIELYRCQQSVTNLLV